MRCMVDRLPVAIADCRTSLTKHYSRCTTATLASRNKVGQAHAVISGTSYVLYI